MSNPLTNFSQLVGSQIRFLIGSNLTKKNFKANVSEIHHLLGLYGPDAFLFLLRSLITNIDFKDQRAQKDQFRIQLLTMELAAAFKLPNFTSIICQTIEVVDSGKVNEEFLVQFCKTLKLSLPQEIALGISLAQSADSNVRQEAQKYIKTKITDLTNNAIKSLPETTLHNLLYFLRSSDGTFPKQTQIIKAAQKSSPSNSALLLPLLETEILAVNSKETYSKEGSKNVLAQELDNSFHVSDLMQDLGYSCCESSQTLKEVFSETSTTLKEKDVALILSMMARTHSSLDSGIKLASFKSASSEEKVSESKTWNINVFVEVVKELAPKLNWALILKFFDHPSFFLSDSKGLALIINAHRRGTKESFPIDFLFETWENSASQLSFISTILTSEVFPFYLTVEKRVDIEGISSLVNKISTFTFHPLWYYLSLFDTLLRLAEKENYSLVRSLFTNTSIKQAPELIVLALCQTQSSYQLLLNDLISTYLPPLILSNNSQLLQKILQINYPILIKGLVELFQKDPTTLTKIAEICGSDPKSKFFVSVLDAKPFSFSLNLAAFIATRKSGFLEGWINEKIESNGTKFLIAMAQFLKEKLQKSSKNLDILFIFYVSLLPHFNNLPPKLGEEIKQFAPKFQKVKEIGPVISNPSPSLPSYGMTPMMPSASSLTRLNMPLQSPTLHLSQGTNSSVVGPSMISSPVAVNPSSMTSNNNNSMNNNNLTNPTGTELPKEFSAEVEEQANSYFQKVYTSQISIQDLINLLKQFKNSKDQREQDIFYCMIHNLFDEYRFFHKYPDKELRITGILFGSLIQHQLVVHKPLFMALNYVLKALAKPPGSKMFHFGYTALEQFKSRLSEWSQYCTSLLQIPHMKLHPEIYEYIENALKNPTVGLNSSDFNNSESLTNASINNPTGSSRLVASNSISTPSTPTPSTPNTKPESENIEDKHSLPLDSLLKEAPPNIDPTIQDKIHFIFNNVSQQNMESKAKELRDILDKSENNVKYLSYYLILKRVCLEANFHQLYLAFLEKLNNSKLFQLLLTQTYDAIKALLKAGKVVNSSSERILLKNLGSWLGLTTIARNKPILLKDLSLKDLLFEGYEKGKLICMIPFVCKVLETCTHSKIIKPPNAWIMGILRVLVELYHRPNLKLNLKFEIEVLCKALNLDLNEIKPSSYLKDKKQFTGPNNDFTSNNDQKQTIETSPPSGSINPSNNNNSSQQEGSNQSEGEDNTIISHLHNYVQISASLALFSQNPHLKQYVPLAIDHAIREIIQPVVERSVTIACITAKELVMKDFATEPDEMKVRRAAYLMVQNLAGSLALVTCKEPLRVSMSNHLRSFLHDHTPESLLPQLENTILVISSENLDLACTLIEKAATEKAVRDTDHQLAQAFANRKQYREMRTNTPFIDINYARFPRSLPEALRPKIGGLTPQQLRVYEDFSRISPIPSQPFPSSSYPVESNKEISLTSSSASIPNVPIETPQPMSVPPQGSSWPDIIQQNLPPNYGGTSPNPTGSTPSQPTQLKIDETKPRGRKPSKDDVNKSNKISHVEGSDPSGLREQVIQTFENWMKLWSQPTLNDKLVTSFISELLQTPMLKNEDASNRFFRICTEMSLEHCLASENKNPNNTTALNYTYIDGFSKLVVLLFKYSTEDTPGSKMTFLSRVLGVIVRVLIKDYDIVKKTKFNQRPFYRLFANFLVDLNSDPALDHIQQILLVFSNAFMMLQPARLPGFSFAWLELISHRMFMPKLLSKGNKGWPLFQRLLVELFKFLEPYLRKAELTEHVRLIYKGTLRVLLVLLHDFPEFLCDYHFSFCDVIPPSCIQMRNLILSAFPRNMRLPDPFTPNLKVDLLPEINQPPRILSAFNPALMANNFQHEIDNYLKNRAPTSWLGELISHLLLNNHEDIMACGTKYNVPVINALVLYVGYQTISSSNQVSSVASSGAAMDIFQHLANELDTEGRYLFLNAIANQLRYPNSHTYWFSCVLLYLFAEATQEIVQEQITRVLLERLIVNRPHPWGLLITFIELIKNPRYHFWSHSFIRYAPEIERLFDSVARSCMVHSEDLNS